MVGGCCGASGYSVLARKASKASSRLLQVAWTGSGTKWVCRCGEVEWAGHRGDSGAVSDGEPAERTDQVASIGSIDDTALGKRIGGGALGGNGFGQRGGIVGKHRAGNDNAVDP